MNLLNRSFTKKTSLIMLFLCGILWSTGGVLIKITTLDALAITSWRSGIAALFLFFVLKGRLKMPRPATAIGSFFYCCTVILFVLANKNTSAANAILLQYCSPIYAALLGWWLLKEPIKLVDWLAVVGIGGGMLLFFSDSIGNGQLFGDIMAVLSGVSFAAMAICMRFNPEDSIYMVFYGNILGFLLGLPILLTSSPTVTDGVVITIMGIFQLALPYILFAVASKKASALELMLVPMIEPILNPVWVMLIYAEIPSLNSILGGIVVLAAVGARSFFAMRADQKSKLNEAVEASTAEPLSKPLAEASDA
ncbi:MAG: DMT family transporter [Christensenellales bacterium]